MAVSYRYLLTDLVSGTVIGELQFSGVSWSQTLNAPGEFSGSININDYRLQNKVGTAAAGYNSSIEYITQPARTGLYVERDGNIVWGGIIWTRTWEPISQELSITAQTFETYWEHRIVQTASHITTDIQSACVFDEGTDQFQVIMGDSTVGSEGGILWNMGATLNGSIATTNDIGIQYDTSSYSGIGIPNTFVVYDYENKKLSQVVSELTEQSAPAASGTQYGFDWAINATYDSTGNIVRIFNMYYPAKGIQDTTSSALPMLEFPGSIVQYSWPEDGTTMVTRLIGIGPGSAEGQYITTYRAPSKTDVSTYPPLDDVASFTQIPDVDMVDNLTQARADLLGAPVVTPSITWVPVTQELRDLPANIAATGTTVSVSPNIGEFETGDLFRIRLNDARFYGGAEFVYRLTRFTVDVGDKGSSEVVTGEFSLPTY